MKNIAEPLSRDIIPPAGPAPAPVGVAYVLPGLARGGAERNVLELASRIDRRRFAPCVVCTSEGGGFEPDLRAIGVPVHVLGYRGFSRKGRLIGRLLKANLAAARRYRGILRERNIRIVHSYLPEGNLVGTLAAPFFPRLARIVSKRALCLYKEGHPVLAFFEDAANLLADAITVNSNAVAEDVRRHERCWDGKVRLVYNGIDTALPRAEPIERLCPDLPGRAGDPTIVYAANFFHYKGHRDLVDAARVVADAFPSVRFLLVGGDAGEMEPVRRLVASMELSGNVFLAGPRPDARTIIAASTFVAHPSHQEGFSNAILEAMVAGKAVVATRAGGIPEAVVDGETGLLVPSGAPRELAAALLDLLRDPERARAMGEAGRRRVLDLFTVEKMVAAVERLYEDVLAEKRSPGMA